MIRVFPPGTKTAAAAAAVWRGVYGPLLKGLICCCCYYCCFCCRWVCFLWEAIDTPLTAVSSVPCCCCCYFCC